VRGLDGATDERNDGWIRGRERGRERVIAVESKGRRDQVVRPDGEEISSERELACAVAPRGVSIIAPSCGS